MAYDYDFIGFSYDGKHCIQDFQIYRTSDGSRYNDNIIPQLNDKTAEVPGIEGQYFLSTKHKAKQFAINIAFDHLTEQKYHEMRRWLDGRKIAELIFDEAPYKVYSAKVTGTPQLKTIAFQENGKRIYKGEGTIQFTCYYPYAHTPVKTESNEDGRFLNSYRSTDYPSKEEWQDGSGLISSRTLRFGENSGDLPAPFVLEISHYIDNGIKIIPKNSEFLINGKGITITEPCWNLKWDSKTGLVTGTKTKDNEERSLVPYLGKSCMTLPVAAEATKSEMFNKCDYSINYQFWYY